MNENCCSGNTHVDARHRLLVSSRVILERAILRIAPGAEDAFETAFAAARTIVAQSPGFLSLRLLRGIEEPSTYLLLIEWDSVADHMDRFRGSALYARWSELLRPHFGSAPEVEHYEPIAGET